MFLVHREGMGNQKQFMVKVNKVTYAVRHTVSRRETMKILVYILLLALAQNSYGCSCLPLPSFEVAVANARDGAKPYYLAKVLSEDRPADINGQVTYVLSAQTGCNSQRQQIATTCGNGACCGIRLQIGETYAMALSRDGSSTGVNSCQLTRLASRLTTPQRDLVLKCSTEPGMYKCSWKCTYNSGKRCSIPCRRCCVNGKCVNTNICYGSCAGPCRKPPSQKPICSYECRPSFLKLRDCWMRCKCCCLNGKCTRSDCTGGCMDAKCTRKRE